MFLNFFKHNKINNKKYKVVVMKLAPDTKLQINDTVVDISGDSDILFITEQDELLADGEIFGFDEDLFYPDDQNDNSFADEY